MNWNPKDSNPYTTPQQSYPQPGGHDPYARQKSGGGLMWLWLLLGGGGLVVLLCCGACCGLGLYGMEEEERQLEAMFANHPTVVEQLGGIESVERDWSASMDEDDDKIWYYNVKGVHADGVIIIREAPFNIDAEDLELEWARLQTDTGEEFDIYP